MAPSPATPTISSTRLRRRRRVVDRVAQFLARHVVRSPVGLADGGRPA
jgi:hypothetical protein